MMIVVVEGISAAGKTTWCRSHGQSYLIPETFPADRQAQPLTGIATAQYWTDWNAKRWGDALEMEREKGCAVCDTDPLKLHYSWCLYQIDALPKRQWELQLQTTRIALLERRLGFADAYFVKAIDPLIAKQQCEGDTSRLRDRFEVHVRLQPFLIQWYALLGEAVGGRVRWTLPDDGLPTDAILDSELRYDVKVFDRFVSSLETKAAQSLFAHEGRFGLQPT
ncbi:hypothetical protein [Sinorhizobium meliloti]|uniref:hypothetical protein n=1 Tax=Rhizobium meliloti TaxID=382 RepID=UPI000FD8E777|nr:hypothetical protein [Sinorhizobium meliloti]MDW9374112.1 hypothetical protein [Sinorhizobium meliloti]MDW9463904.1 hypothetical protein [Sinorhizobium meliloti]MDW9492559.1 hypothetical protein [Sinorhizobium meliloti]MDW9561042.1 hypothetical protein [Sinorhizobium meliloti]MDW9596613.1 hypothetical protein [Sinorhizobium meliloti]